MLTGLSRCPVKPFKGTKLVHVPKSTLRDFLYNDDYRENQPDLIDYARSQFSSNDLEVIDREYGERISIINQLALANVEAQRIIGNAYSDQIRATMDNNFLRLLGHNTSENTSPITSLNVSPSLPTAINVKTITKKVDKSLYLKYERDLEI